jgi:hypothetical protein
MSTPFFGATADFNPVQNKSRSSLHSLLLLDSKISFFLISTDYSTALRPRSERLLQALGINRLTGESFLKHVEHSG